MGQKPLETSPCVYQGTNFLQSIRQHVYVPFFVQTLWGLKVCNPEIVATDDETRAIHNLNLKIHKDTRVEMCMLPMADGVHIVMKL